MSKLKKFILATSCVFIAVFSFLVPTFTNDRVVAKADTITTVTTFNTSNIYMPVRRDTSNASDAIDVLLFACDMTYDSFSSSYQLNFGRTLGFYIRNNYQSSSDSLYRNYTFIEAVSTNSSFNSTSLILSSSNYTFNFYYRSTYQSTDTSYCKLNIKYDSGFNCDISSIDIGSNPIGSSSFSGYPENFVRYNDVNGNSLTFSFQAPKGANGSNTTLLAPRTYFINLDLSDNQLYETGYNQGLLDNQSNIYNQGYNAGNSAGYGAGYDAGLEASNQYSFLSLFGAVLDAPINAVKGLLNFEVFGVNLLTLFTGLLTLAIILLVLKLMRGGK